MTLKRKILSGYGVSFALMALVIAWAVMNLVSLGDAGNAILRENYRSILASERMLNALERQDSATLYLFLENPGESARLFRENEFNFLQWLARAKDNITIDKEEGLIQNIESGYTEYVRLYANFSRQAETLNLTKNSWSTDYNEIYQKKIYPVFNSIRENCIRLRNVNERYMYQASVKAGKVAVRAIWSTVFIAAAAILLGLIFSLIISERFVRPLKRFADASRLLAGGQYNVQVSVDSSDEFGQLAHEFNQMAAKLAAFHEMNIEQIISEKQKIETILASIDDGVVVLDTELKTIGINPAAKGMLGLEFQNCAMLPCSEYLPDEHILKLLNQSVATGKNPPKTGPEHTLTIGGETERRHFHYSITLIHRRKSSLYGVVLLLRDITRLKEVDRLKSEFVMAASHELRTPLTSIGMSIDLLLENDGNFFKPKHKELLEAAHFEVNRLKALVADLLNLSRIEAGKIEMEFESISAANLVEHIERVFYGQMKQKNIRYSSDIESGLPEIRADADKITWVLSNLIANALKVLSEGGILHIGVARIGTYVQFSVKDNGPGVPPEYHRAIFQKFVQVKGREAGGTGLGLAICKEIVRAHGGAIWVESRADEGSIFFFTIPVILPEEES